MAPALQRLKRRSEFLRVAAARHKWVAPGLILQMRRRHAGEEDKCTADSVRVGFTASRKVGNAVVRNRARRRLREIVRQIAPTGVMPGHDLVVIARAATVSRPFDSLSRDFTRGLRKLGIYRSAESEGGDGGLPS